MKLSSSGALLSGAAHMRHLFNQSDNHAPQDVMQCSEFMSMQGFEGDAVQYASSTVADHVYPSSSASLQ